MVSPYRARLSPDCSTSTISRPTCQYACTMAVLIVRATVPRACSRISATRENSSSMLSFALAMAEPIDDHFPANPGGFESVRSHTVVARTEAANDFLQLARTGREETAELGDAKVLAVAGQKRLA